MTSIDEFKMLCRRLDGVAPRVLSAARPVWIFGAGPFGRDVCAVLRQRGFEIAGFIETLPKHREVLGLPVLAWTELNAAQRQMQLALSIFNRSTPMDELARLAHDAGFNEVCMPWHIYAQFGADLGWRYWLSAPQVLLAALPQIEVVYQQLADEASCRCLLDILTFRLGANTAYASFQHDQRQYFNDLSLPALRGRPVAYVDGGAYNGDTYLELAALAQLGNAFLFEPDAVNYRQLIDKVGAKVSSNAHVLCLPLALADSYRILSFNSDGGEGGAIAEHGSQHIATVALDDLLHGQHVDFIKLDVEGAEIAALNGAAHVITRCRPVLAVSLYHRPQDIWELPILLGQLCNNYHFYIRQHYANSFESVLYAVPR